MRVECDPRAYARCPQHMRCECIGEFVEGSWCDEFNRKILDASMTNAGRVRRMTNAELEPPMNESCDTCVSRFLCPNNYRPCAGWNDEGAFWALVKLTFPFMCDEIDRKREFIKSLQAENKEATND